MHAKGSSSIACVQETEVVQCYYCTKFKSESRKKWWRVRGGQVVGRMMFTLILWVVLRRWRMQARETHTHNWIETAIMVQVKDSEDLSHDQSSGSGEHSIK